ncbi:hypothetical protein PoB_003183900 [Plakobranchus ocellatus]|uniref:Uncharacterized protein n=1 Tax=Plakobranchus ocellatus TaxID=259542 RepID=A0AAV4AFX6_9GAST|nr:hypothetical protein PoB_003183900 [Plakobranchus ocellatus]
MLRRNPHPGARSMAASHIQGPDLWPRHTSRGPIYGRVTHPGARSMVASFSHCRKHCANRNVLDEVEKPNLYNSSPLAKHIGNPNKQEMWGGAFRSEIYRDSSVAGFEPSRRRPGLMEALKPEIALLWTRYISNLVSTAMPGYPKLGRYQSRLDKVEHFGAPMAGLVRDKWRNVWQASSHEPQ